LSKRGRIDERFADCRARGRKALIPYITAGYPTPEATPEILEMLVRAGADIIELGVPFSDPVADGPTIQRSSQRALENGVTLNWSLRALQVFRETHSTPVVLFSYLNPILAHGVVRFLEDALGSGADGVLITDLPVGSDSSLEEMFETSDLSLIRLVAPTTSRVRAREVARRAQGFLYYIARTGVTGATASLREGLVRELTELRAVTEVPIAVGFGISTPAQAAEVARVADGVVVGSALINALDLGGIPAAEEFISGLREAIDANASPRPVSASHSNHLS
jgi:tryptophan synthase alpha chain